MGVLVISWAESTRAGYLSAAVIGRRENGCKAFPLGGGFQRPLGLVGFPLAHRGHVRAAIVKAHGGVTADERGNLTEDDRQGGMRCHNLRLAKLFGTKKMQQNSPR